MPVLHTMPSNLTAHEGKLTERILDNEIDWDFQSKFNPGLVKQTQNLWEFDQWISWIKETWSFPLDRPFNYLEIGSYAGESLFYLSQVFPRGSVITLVDLGDNEVARGVLKRVIPHIEATYGHKINLLSGFSDDKQIIHQAKAYPQGQVNYDMVFIDANHDFKWAYKDFINYRYLADWVTFHDISDFNIIKTVIKYNVEIANAAHLWKSITSVLPNYTWAQFVDPNMDLKPRGIGVIQLP